MEKLKESIKTLFTDLGFVASDAEKLSFALSLEILDKAVNKILDNDKQRQELRSALQKGDTTKIAEIIASLDQLKFSEELSLTAEETLTEALEDFIDELNAEELAYFQPRVDEAMQKMKERDTFQ